MKESSPEMMAVLQAVRMASELCRRIQKDLAPAGLILKSDRSPVTIADFASQAILCRVLREQFPGDTLVAEETSSDLQKPDHRFLLEKVTEYINSVVPKTSPEEVCHWIGSASHVISGRYWAIDPIDGTKGFLRGAQYAIALALIERGTVRMGILSCPSLRRDAARPNGAKGCLFLAVRGKGAYQMDHRGEGRKRLSVSKITDVREAAFTDSVEPEHGDYATHQEIAGMLQVLRPAVKIDGQVKYTLLARGEAALFLRLPSPLRPGYKERIWDHAAGSILVEEAGGRVTDARGDALDFSSGIQMEKNHGILASNGLLHDTALDAVKRKMQENRPATHNFTRMNEEANSHPDREPSLNGLRNESE